MELIKKCLIHYTDFKGRARRKEYWMFWLFMGLISIVTHFIDYAIGTGSLIANVTMLGLFLPFLAVSVRRMHDLNKSGLEVLFLYLSIPIIIGAAVLSKAHPTTGTVVLGGIIALLVAAYALYYFVLLVTRGDTEDNKYGPDPKKSLIA
jgi:uncharacterized membrane protein YhaH (DUF805 family)